MGVRSRWTHRVERVRGRFEALRAKAEHRLPVLTELTVRLFSANLLDASTRLAAQAFLTTVPLLFAFAAFCPQSLRDQLVDSLREVFGLTGGAQAQVQEVLGTQSDDASLRETTGVVGLVVALASATSFSRAMSRVCQSAWALPKAPTRSAVWRWVVWLLVLVVVLVVQGPLRSGFGVGLWAGVPVSFLVGVAVWWWTQHLLLAARVGWLPLLPGAVLCATATTALGLTARIYVPRALNRSLAEYGSLGLVLVCLSWLIVLCAAVTIAITVGAVLAQGPPLNRHLRAPAAEPRPRATDLT